jgi:hypothetical protein
VREPGLSKPQRAKDIWTVGSREDMWLEIRLFGEKVPWEEVYIV